MFLRRFLKEEGTVEVGMPKGPNGEKRPRDTIGCAVHVMKIATGEVEEDKPQHRNSKVNGAKLERSP